MWKEISATISQFIPANSQDFGFRGELYVLADSSLHVKKCNLYMPHNSDVNWVTDMKIEQEYTKGSTTASGCSLKTI